MLLLSVLGFAAQAYLLTVFDPKGVSGKTITTLADSRWLSPGTATFPSTSTVTLVGAELNVTGLADNDHVDFTASSVNDSYAGLYLVGRFDALEAARTVDIYVSTDNYATPCATFTIPLRGPASVVRAEHHISCIYTSRFPSTAGPVTLRMKFPSIPSSEHIVFGNTRNTTQEVIRLEAAAASCPARTCVHGATAATSYATNFRIMSFFGPNGRYACTAQPAGPPYAMKVKRIDCKCNCHAIAAGIASP